MARKLLLVIAVVALILGVMSPLSAATPDRIAVDVPDHIADLKLSSPLTADVASLDASLARASGSQQVIVRLAAPSASDKADKKRVEAGQADFLARVRAIAPEAEVIASVQHVLNAVFLEVDAASLPALAADTAVFRINPVANYELDLSETVPYIGGTAAQGMGYDGSGVKVAVLDSGIDYTHANLGGGGTLADYAAAYGVSPLDPLNTTRDGLFPTADVVEGYDFVGELWPTNNCDAAGNFPGSLQCPLRPDEDPIDYEGHGTHVADIIGGNGGVAPGVDLVGVKVCSSLTPSCSGIALIQGMDFAVEQDVDIINMSLGANYGLPFDDDLSAAVDAASALGILTVSSAGNGGNKPFIQGSPSGATTALSVAQTAVPSAVQYRMRVDQPTSAAGLYNVAKFAWSGDLPPAGIAGPVTYVGLLTGVDSRGCDLGDGSNPYIAAGHTLSGIVLVDRGACRFDEKVLNIEEAGGALAIVGLVAPGDPFAGGGDPIVTIPGFMASQADANILRTGSAVVAFDPADGIPLVGSVVGSSSRGPQIQNFWIKPEIGAPGASLSAEAGTGDGETTFGGTSGASPMVAGSAALVLQAYPGLSPAESRARIMNTGETEILNEVTGVDEGGNPVGPLAPVSRIGGGEVRVDRAVSVAAAAWDEDTLQGGLSLGFVDVADKKEKIKKTVVVKNYSDEDVEFTITPTFRNEAAPGAVTVKAPKKVKVKAGKDKKFDIEFEFDGMAMAPWNMNSGSGGADAGLLTAMEFDGYLLLEDGENDIHLAWHALARKDAEVKIEGRKYLKFDKDGEAELKLKNEGVGMAQNDAFSLLWVSPDIAAGGRGEQAPTPDLRAVGVQTYGAVFCDAGWLLAIGVNTWEPQTHAITPANHRVDLDTNLDGFSDYTVLTGDFSRFFAPPWNLSDGRALTYVINWGAGTVGAFFFAEHAVNTGNTVMYLCGEQIGSHPLGAPINATAAVDDIYYGGPGDSAGSTDTFGTGAMTEVGFTFAPLGERYYPVDGLVDLGYKEKTEITFFDFESAFPGTTNPGELGALIFTNGDRGFGNRGGATPATEALIIPAKEFKKEVKDILKGKTPKMG